jgi:hypothetical protein
MLKRRLFVAQGSQQLLLGLVCLRQCAIQKEGETHPLDTPILGDFMAQGAAMNIDVTCRIISRQHPFNRVCTTLVKPPLFHGGTIDFADYSAVALQLIGCGLFNEIVLHASVKSHKIPIGDGFGIIEINSICLPNSILPAGSTPVNEIRTLPPEEFEPGAFYGLHIRRLKPIQDVDGVRQTNRELKVAKSVPRLAPTISGSPDTFLLIADLNFSLRMVLMNSGKIYFIDSVLTYLEQACGVRVKGHLCHCDISLGRCLRWLFKLESSAHRVIRELHKTTE